MNDSPRLFLLDAYALIYRAYYALIRAPRVTSRGLNTSAIFGFCNTLDDLLRKENPTHIAVCFDPSGPTFRHEVYPEYKANRQAQPEDITNAIPYIKRILAAMCIPVIERPGYEADDVIGTLSRRAEVEGFVTYMMTPDKDYGQLVTDRVFMYRPAIKGQGFEVRGPQQVCERYGIDSPKQVIDLLALEGDASDNVPGCPGVGEKTAAKLINQWGSVENLIANIESLKGALKQKIADNAEQILFSKELVTIKTDVPLDDIDFNDMERCAANDNDLRQVYEELEFKSFLAKLNATDAVRQAMSESTPPAVAKDDSGMGSLFDFVDEEPEAPATERRKEDAVYARLSTIDEISTFAAAAHAQESVGVAFFSLGENAMTARLFGVALSTAAGENAFVDLDSSDAAERLQALAPVFAAGGASIVSHDIKRDMVLLHTRGIDFEAPYFDTSIAHYLLQSEQRHDLPEVARTYLNYTTDDYDLDARRRKPYTMPEVADIDGHFVEAAEVSRRLMPILTEAIEAEAMGALLRDIELPFARVLARMEWTGVRIDVAELATLSALLTERLTALENEAYKIAGKPFNIGSPTQVGEVLFGQLQIDPKAKRTKTGAWSTTEEILEKYKADNPIVGIILQVRGLRKLLATYINALPAMINPADGKIHTTFNQTVTATGRISSTNPNLQNIPIRTDDGREIRRAFIPDPGCVMLSADYSQIELRLMADISGDPDMVEAFRSGEDIHRATAAKIYKLTPAEVTDTQRRNAKTANFGIIYGISAFGLSERLGIPRAEAKEIIQGILTTYPRVKEYMEEAVERARTDGYVTTVHGRRRRLPDINSRNAVVRGYAERNAVNAPLQGSAADIIKVAMIAIDRRFAAEGLRSQMILQVHDELVFNVVPDELARVQEIVTYEMEHAYNGNVPLLVAAGTGANWLEAH